jgi:hypothetical protein
MEKLKKASVGKKRPAPGSPSMYPMEYTLTRNEMKAMTTSIITETGSSMNPILAAKEPVSRSKAIQTCSQASAVRPG